MSQVSIERAVELLKQGDVVAIPTETVYGLAGRIGSPQALKAIFKTKNRPFFDPLIVHVQDEGQAKALTTDWGPAAETLAAQFWPGPLTLVLKRSQNLNPMISSGLETVALRCPKHPVALDVIRAVGEPLAAPSANPFGRTSPSRPEHVESGFGGAVPVVYGGPCEVGIESTVISVRERDSSTGPQISILRPGIISQSQIEEALKAKGIHPTFNHQSNKASPGHLEHHYQPQKPLVIISPSVPMPEVISQIEDRLKLRSPTIAWLKVSQDPRLAARELYHQMHSLDSNKESVIGFLQPPDWQNSAWAAIRDRLNRASSLAIT